VLTGIFRYPPRAAVALNLAISLITAAALTVRTVTLDTAAVVSLLPVAAAITLGAVIAAYLGVGWVHRISDVQLRRMILVLLLSIGVGLIVEAFAPGETAGLLPELSLVQLAVGGRLRARDRADQQPAGGRRG
jgi:uncharacterized protein